MSKAADKTYRYTGLNFEEGERISAFHEETRNSNFKKGCLIVAFILSTLVLCPAFSMADEVVLIAHADVPASSLSRDDVKRIFLGKKTTWDDGGGKIVLAVQQRTEASRLFLGKYVGKSVYQYIIYWKKRVFAGKGSPPVSFSSDREVAEFVSKTPGAVGYVSAGTAFENVKTVSIFDKGVRTE